MRSGYLAGNRVALINYPLKSVNHVPSQKCKLCARSYTTHQQVCRASLSSVAGGKEKRLGRCGSVRISTCLVILSQEGHKDIRNQISNRSH